MKTILKFKWSILGIWVIVIAALMLTAPNLSDLVRHKGQAKVPDGYSSSTASHLLDDMHKQKGASNSSGVTLVFYDKKGLNASDRKSIKHAVQELKKNKNSLQINKITDTFDQPDLKKQLISKNGTTMIVSLNIVKAGSQTGKITSSLYKAIDDVHLSHYYTSGWMINDDMVTSTQAGLHKTEWITVVFILVVLFIVFRSVIAPLVPLVTVGVSFIVSQSIISFLAKAFNFPLSNFTQIFLVAVLFGIGTDYCILLLSRFKEELPRHESTRDAIVATYRHGGRTVFFSGLAVFIGFSAIGFSTFSIYQSAVGVAVGIVALIIALVTIVPFFMAVLGTKLFWPAIGSMEHKQSKLWDRAGRFAVNRSFIALLIVAIITVPFLFKYNGDLSFNSLDDIGNQYKSVKGFNTISNNFGPGESMPTQIVIKNDEPLNTQKGLLTIESISREIKKIPGVKTVRSVTRPTGDPIKNFLVPYQAKSLSGGIKSSQDALNKIGIGLNQAANQLTQSEPQLQSSISGLQKLIDATGTLKSGVGKLGDGLGQLQTGLNQTANGANKLSSSIKQSEQGAKQLEATSQNLLNGYQQINTNLKKLNNGYDQIVANLDQFSTGLQSVSQHLQNLGQHHPEIVSDPDFQTALGTTKQLQSNVNDLTSKMVQLNQGLHQLTGKMGQANAGLSKLAQGQAALSNGLSQLVTGMEQLRQAIIKDATGTGQIKSKVPSVQTGLDQLQTGQKQIKNGFSQLNGQIKSLTNGLNQSISGLTKVSNGLGDARQYLKNLSQSTNALSGFYIPSQALHSSTFKQAMDNYMSPDRKITTVDVVFNENPYSLKAINQISDVKKAVDRATKGTPLENAKVGIGGVTSTNADLKQISQQDYSRTMLLMLIGIGLILALLFRSLIMPLYIILSLVITYYTSMGIAETIFENIFGYSGISWAVPFFAFVMLIALGVDYSIFLMDRFNEYKTISVKDAILEAMRNMGTVILSAAVILAGTFGAMIPSGVLSLMEIATIIIIGLFLYSIIMLPLFIPVMVRIFGESNWWPYKRTEH